MMQNPFRLCEFCIIRPKFGLGCGLLDEFSRQEYVTKMATYMAGVRGRLREMLVVVAQTLPIFVIVAYFSTAEKALVATMAFFSIWTAVSARWEGRSRSGFWWLVGLLVLANVIAIWAIPINHSFSSGHAVAYPLGMAEGFLVYWLLGWWISRDRSAQ